MFVKGKIVEIKEDGTRVIKVNLNDIFNNDGEKITEDTRINKELITNETRPSN